MMHNSFDEVITATGVKLISHNFPEFAGEGLTIHNAIKDLNRKIMHYKDNHSMSYRNRLIARIKKGLECECGILLKEKPLGFYKSKE